MTQTVRRFANGGSGIAVSMAIMNVATYGFVILALRLLGTGYSALGASLNLLLVISVGALGLQATAARRISADPEHVAQIEDSILRVTYRAAAALGLLLLIASPLIQRVLNLDHLGSAVIIAISAVPMTLVGGLAGILQGERRWAPLGLLYIASGVPRLVIAGAVIAWRPTEFWSLVGVGISFWAPVLVGWWALRHERRASKAVATHSGRALLKESVGNAQALFAYFALSSVDLIVAVNILPKHEASLYGAGLVVTKAMLFLPQFVVIVSFPSMSTGAERRKALVLSLSLVAVIGTLGTAACWLLSGIAMRFAGGAEFGEMEPRLWIFAVLGTVLALNQMLIYSVLARQGKRSVYVVWLALLVLIGVGLTADSIIGLVSIAISVDVGLLVVLLGITAWFLRAGAPVPDEPAPAVV